jgi:uncharacterized delta-60 repeat protein
VRWQSFTMLLLFASSLILFAIETPKAVAQSSMLVQKTWGGSSSDIGQSVAIDSSGDMYVTGYTLSFGPGSPSYAAVTLLKYSSVGTLLWEKIWSGSGNGSEFGYGVAVDTSGDVYVTGYTGSFGVTGFDVFLLKFNSSGNLVWQKTWGGNSNDFGYGVGVDASGNIYVTGATQSFGAGAYDVVLLKFNSTGSLVWQKTWGGTGDDEGLSVALDSSGNIYVGGETSSAGAGGIDALLLKFSPSGSLLFQKIWGGSNIDYAYGVAVDFSGNIYLAGTTVSTGAGGGDVFLLKFDSTSGLLWQRTWGGSNNEYGYGVAVGPSGDIYVTGQTASFSVANIDAFLLKFDSTGSLLWQKIWVAGNYSVGNAVAVDSSDSPVVTGYVHGPPPYNLKSSNGTVGIPTLAVVVPTFTLGNPTFMLHTPTGTVQTPSGSQTYAGSADELLFKYGEIPTLTFNTNPAGGIIIFNETAYTSGQTGNYTYGNATASTTPPVGYKFTSWNTSGGVSVISSTVSPTTVVIVGSGTLTANFAKTSATPLTPLSILLTILVPSLYVGRKRRIMR